MENRTGQCESDKCKQLGTLPLFDHIHIDNLIVSRVESCPVIFLVKLVPAWSLIKKCMRFYPLIILQSLFSQRHL